MKLGYCCYSDGLGFLDDRALTLGLKCVSNLMLVWARRIQDDPEIMKTGVPEQFRFAEDYTSSVIRSKLHHHRLGSHVREDFNALMPFYMAKWVMHV